MKFLVGLMFCAISGGAVAEVFSYEGYAKVLKTYVDDRGLVDYSALKANRGELDQFVADLGRLKRSDFDTWNEDSKIAFWCNAYNAITLKYIIDHYPIQKGGLLARVRFPHNSIRQIDGVWKELTSPVMGRPLTLDAIEHEILRVNFVEPRIHMAIVCAAISCPKLRNEPYTGDRLDEQLEDQSRAFCTNPEKVRVDIAEGRVYLSPILDWFGEDFTGPYRPDSGFDRLRGQERSVVHFVSRHVGAAEAEFLRNGKYAVRYLDYDWTLNEQ